MSPDTINIVQIDTYGQRSANVRAIYTYDYTKQIVIVRRQWPRMAMPRVRVARNAYIVCIGRLGGVRGIYVCTVKRCT